MTNTALPKVTAEPASRAERGTCTSRHAALAKRIVAGSLGIFLFRPCRGCPQGRGFVKSAAMPTAEIIRSLWLPRSSGAVWDTLRLTRAGSSPGDAPDGCGLPGLGLFHSLQQCRHERP